MPLHASALKGEVKVKCFCKSYKCAGKMVSSRVMKRHVKKDYLQKEQVRCSVNSTNLASISPYYPILYETHWTARTRLFKDSEHWVLEYIYMEMRNFVSHPSHTKDAVRTNFETNRKILPKPNHGCSSFDDARQMIKEFLLPLVKYDVCPNDCIIFTGEHEKKKECPVCFSPRFEEGKPRRVFKYFPLAPRIARLYQDENLVRVLQSHCRREDDGVLRDFWDTERWKGWYEESGLFGGDSSGISLNFCTDGVNPFRKMHCQYSMWPLMMSIMNFPPSLRKAVGGILLLGIIPSNGRQEPFHLDPYFTLIVNELLVLCEAHIYYPSYMKAPVQIKTYLLQFILDFPAISKVMHQPAQGGIQACPWCRICGVYVKGYHKTIYMDGRRYLRCDHCLRKSNSFTSNEVRLKPTTYKPKEEMAKRKVFDKLPNENQRKKFTRENGLKGSNIWSKLPYHNMHEHYLPDGMHTIADAVQNLLSWLIGKETTEKLQAGEIEMGVVKKDLRNGKIRPLSEKEKEIGNKRCSELEFPKRCAGNKGDVFNKPEVTLKNTHGWMEYTSLRIWRFLLKGALKTRQRRTVVLLLDVLGRMHDKSYSKGEIDRLEEDTNIVLALLERDLPLWLCNITTHILRHIITKIRENGPIYSSWMYPYERMNSWLTRRAMNRSKVEECIMETYQAYDWVCFSQFLGRFDHLDKDSKTMAHFFQRDGIVDKTVIHGTPEELNNRQKRQASTSSEIATQHKQLDIINTDLSYYPGDYVYVPEKNKFGQIEALLMIDGIQWADLAMFGEHQQDEETGLVFANDNLEDVYELHRLSGLSSTLVTCEEYQIRWFVSFYLDAKKFVWYDEHVSL